MPAAYKSEPWSRLGVDVDNGFKPLYVVSSDKKSQVAKLKQLVKQASEVYLASDEDREGESIAWHLLEVLAPTVPVKRMVFHEITKPAIERAVQEWRDLDRRLVDAQEARRILDRLYGYEVSPVLWKKIMPRLSAGRVQSVATRMVVERERSRMAFRSASWWGIDATFRSEGEVPEGVPRAFTGSLVALDGRTLASGRDFDSTGRLSASDPVVVLDEGGARSLASGLAGVPFRVASVTERPVPALTVAPVHDLDPPAGGGPEAPVRLAPRDAGRPAPLRGGVDHLHAHRLDDTVERGARRCAHPGGRRCTATSTSPPRRAVTSGR